MAKTFSIVERTTGPTSVFAAATPGGSLAASTTYYYKVAISLQSLNAYYNADATLSAPSNEFSVTTTVANKTAQIYFDNNVTLLGADWGYVHLWRTTISGDYAQTTAVGAWRNNYIRLTNSDWFGMGGLYLGNASCFKVYTFTTAVGIASLTPGETITEQTTGATAIVVSDPAGGNTFKVRSLTGSWTNAYNFDGSISGLNLGKWSSTSAQVGYCILDDNANGNSQTPLMANGMPTVYYNGGTSGDPITPQDVYDWLVAQGKTYCIDMIPVYPTGDWRNSAGNDIGAMFRWRFNLMQSPNTTTYFRIDGNVMVYHMWGKFYAETNSTVQFGQYATVGSGGYTYSGGVYVTNSFAAWSRGMLGDSNIYASYVQGPIAPSQYSQQSKCARDPSFQNTTLTKAMRIWDSIWKGADGERNGTIFDIRRSRIMSTSKEISNDAAYVYRATFDPPLGNIWTVCNDVYHANEIYVERGTDDVFMGCGESTYNCQAFHFLDTTWAHANLTVKAYPPSSNGVPADFVCLDEYTYTLTVLDNSGNPIQGASVTIVDKNGRSQAITLSGTYTKVNTKYDKVTTSIQTEGTAPTLGAVYRLGLERIRIESGSNPYTVTRAYDGSTANYLGGQGGYNSYKRHRFNLVNPSLTTDANGQVTCRVLWRYWSIYDYNNPGVFTYIDASLVNLNPYTVTVSAAGYYTKTVTYTITGTRSDVVAMVPDGSLNAVGFGNNRRLGGR